MHKKTIYKVYDSQGGWLRTFSTLKEARTFKAIMGRQDWPIVPVVKLY